MLQLVGRPRRHRIGDRVLGARHSARLCVSGYACRRQGRDIAFTYSRSRDFRPGACAARCSRTEEGTFSEAVGARPPHWKPLMYSRTRLSY